MRYINLRKENVGLGSNLLHWYVLEPMTRKYNYIIRWLSWYAVISYSGRAKLKPSPKCKNTVKCFLRKKDYTLKLLRIRNRRHFNRILHLKRKCRLTLTYCFINLIAANSRNYRDSQMNWYLIWPVIEHNAQESD